MPPPQTCVLRAELGQLPGESGFWRFNRTEDYGLKVGVHVLGSCASLVDPPRFAGLARYGVASFSAPFRLPLPCSQPLRCPACSPRLQGDNETPEQLKATFG